MKIKNTTKWSTKDLRKIFSRCIDTVRQYEGRGRKKGIFIKVINGYNWRKRSMSGRAWIGYYEMTIKIGDEVDLRKIEERKKLAQIFTHEYYHNLGFKSQDYKEYKRDWTTSFDYSWVKNYPIELAPVKVKPKVDIQQVRYNRAIANLKRAETRLKRAKTIYKKWQDKAKYYEVVFANHKADHKI